MENRPVIITLTGTNGAVYDVELLGIAAICLIDMGSLDGGAKKPFVQAHLYGGGVLTFHHSIHEELVKAWRVTRGVT